MNMRFFAVLLCVFWIGVATILFAVSAGFAQDAQDSEDAEEPLTLEDLLGRYVMALDEVTTLELREDGTFAYEDPMQVYSATYTFAQGEVVLNFSALQWYFGDSMDCAAVDNATLECSDGERYLREETLDANRVFGKYLHEDDPEVSLSLQSTMEYFYATAEGICAYRYEIHDSRVHVHLWDCEALGEGTMICTLENGELDCSNEVTYIRK
ncbi:MAG: hypothetical protein D6E12_11670 [Desulfovibrio sp.]|nr:MAG: hypothetical protein D6E12_11670 [Desulfovibrio sp.]